MVVVATPNRWRGAAAAFASCALVGLLFAGQVYLLNPTNGWAAALVFTMPQWCVWGVLAPFVARSDAALRVHTLRARVLAHVPLGLAWTMVNLSIRFAIRPVLHGVFPPSFVGFVAQRFMWDVQVYAVIAGIVVVRAYAAEARRRERDAAALELRAARLEAGLAEARLHALGSQLQPHFLFNALNTVSAFTEREPKTARRLMAQLGELLRASLDHAARPEVPLRRELAFLDDYLGIERARFADRLDVAVCADDATLDAHVPAFLLQPLVENAIKHGVGPRAAGGRVDVEIRRTGDRLVVRVRDDGVGLPPGWSLDAHAGVGLGNVVGRLEGLYPGRHGFRVAPAGAGGTLAEVDLPFQTMAS